MLTSGIILAKMNHQLFTQTYINILTPFTNLVHCPQIHLPISKAVDKILAAVNVNLEFLNIIAMVAEGWSIAQWSELA